MPVADGGTGASTASAARTNLGFNSYLTAIQRLSLAWLTRNIADFSVSSAQQVWVPDGDIAGSSPSCLLGPHLLVRNGRIARLTESLFIQEVIRGNS